MSGIDHRDTWTVKAVLRDGALGQRTERPNLVYRCLGRCPRSADQSTKLGLPVLGTVPSVSGPIDRTWSAGAWDGALDVLVPEPGRQLNPLNPRQQLNPLDSLPQLSGNSWDVYRTEKGTPKPGRSGPTQEQANDCAQRKNDVPRHSTQGHIRPCLQAYHGIPNRDNTAIPA